ncbi:MAG: hypothetical protein J3K34DRAFT_526734 [Monoraphidium minutum]|nr:MAG: hypothetical protein J3K34DRAFT_526734 [Monoraphidium minutum]
MEGAYGMPVGPRMGPPMMPYYGMAMPGASMGQAMLNGGDYNSAADAAMLADSLESMMLAPGQQMLPGVAPGGYYAPAAAFAGHPGAPAYGYAMPPQQQAQQQGQQQAQQQQQQQQGQQQQQEGGRQGGAPGEQRRGGGRKKRTQRGLEDNVRRTVYISYIDQQVTEESLATFFQDCGTVMDCRICGDPNSAMRFAFIEFAEDAAAQKALTKTGAVLGSSPLRVLPSKTAIVPVNKELMPRTNDELERCSRTVYVANIDKKVDKEDVRSFFEQLCGHVYKIRLLGDFAHSTRIAFIEFGQAEGAMAALNCSGALLGALPLRVSPSKTPVRGDCSDDNGGGGASR